MASPIPVEAHAEKVASLISPTPVVTLPVADCLGLALAADLVAPISLPPFDNSAMDGYAVVAADLAAATDDHPVRLPVVADIPAGRTDPVTIEAGVAARIMTGAPMPGGADAVVPVEQTDRATDTVAIHASVAGGTHLRRAGEDVAAGTTVLSEGTRLTPAALGLAAAVGAGSLPVRRRPRVLVLSTGSELVEPGLPLRKGQIYESNGTMLAAAARSAGCDTEILRFVPDDVASFRSTLDPRLPDVDLVITSGGVSAGAYEVVKDALSGHGVDFVKVAMQPGGPQGAGRYRDVAVVTLPGNPVSSLVSFEVFVRPALRRAMGHTAFRPRTVTARLTEGLRSPAGRRQYRRGDYDAAAGTVRLVGGHGSHLLASMAHSNCLVVVDTDVSELPAGAGVDVMPLDH